MSSAGPPQGANRASLGGVGVRTRRRTMMDRRGTNALERDRSTEGRRRIGEIYRDPAVWAWVVVLLLAMLPVKAAISG